MYRDDVLSTRFGDLNGDLKADKVVLMGTKDGNMVNSVSFSIQKNNQVQSYGTSLAGYDFNLSLANITQPNFDQILITGQSGGSGGYAVFNLFEYRGNKIKLVLNDDKLQRDMKLNIKYMDNYKLSFDSENTNVKFVIDLSKNPKNYLDMIFDKNGKVKKDMYPTILAPTTIYPIQVPGHDRYSLQIQQRVIGASNSDTLGVIQSIIDVDSNSNVTFRDQYFLLMDRNR